MKPKPLILIVEDEVDLSDLISSELEETGMVTQVCHDAKRAEKFVANNFVNLILLDINLPDKSGFQFLQELRNQDNFVPVIFLTANDSEIYKIKGFDLGADDFITKPFSLVELIARIQAVLRRAETSRDYNITKNVKVTDDVFQFCDAQINPRTMEIHFPKGTVEKIGKKELGIFVHLVNNPNRVIPRNNLIHEVWGIHANVRSRSLDQYIVSIRNMFAENGCSIDAFKTVHGVGYIYESV